MAALKIVPAGVLASLLLLIPLAAQQSSRDAGCAEWRACRQMALAAADAGDYERFHDLAWRAVQLGPAKDAALMSLLARAQSLSGRPHDALVMLDRLADMGVATDADTNEDFARTRRLPGWADVLAHIDRVRHDGSSRVVAASPAVATTGTPAAAAASTPAASTTAASPSPAGASEAPAVGTPVEAVRVPAGSFTPGGIAFDAVSDRFLFGDRLGRKLIVVGARSNRATDFVRADSAGFQDITAIEIDAKRGDLWVASSAAASGSGTVHKLQLVSGRPLRAFPVAPEFEPVALADLGVTAAGVVVVLDSGGQLLALRPGATALERIIRLEAVAPSSLAVGADEGVAYVAHRDGVVRVDLRAGTAAPLTAPKSIAVDRLERLRWHARSLLAIRLDEDGSRQIVRFDLNPAGRGITHATTLERSVPTAAPTYMAFAGDELVYLGEGAGGSKAGGSAGAARVGEFIAYRLRLR